MTVKLLPSFQTWQKILPIFKLKCSKFEQNPLLLKILWDKTLLLACLKETIDILQHTL